MISRRKVINHLLVYSGIAGVSLRKFRLHEFVKVPPAKFLPGGWEFYTGANGEVLFQAYSENGGLLAQTSCYLKRVVGDRHFTFRVDFTDKELEAAADGDSDVEIFETVEFVKARIIDTFEKAIPQLLDLNGGPLPWSEKEGVS